MRAKCICGEGVFGPGAVQVGKLEDNRRADEEAERHGGYGETLALTFVCQATLVVNVSNLNLGLLKIPVPMNDMSAYLVCRLQ